VTNHEPPGAETLRDTLAGLGARFDHVAIAGPSMRPLVAFYRDVIGATFEYGEVLPIGAVVMSWFLDGRKIELMAPTPGSTFFDRFFASTAGRGGLHHITFLVEDIDAAHTVVTQHGYSTFGLVHDPAWSEFFVHPRDNGGVLVQVARLDESALTTLKRDPQALIDAAL
jgi:methylmalonyl-CoA epimerase